MDLRQEYITWSLAMINRENVPHKLQLGEYQIQYRRNTWENTHDIYVSGPGIDECPEFSHANMSGSMNEAMDYLENSGIFAGETVTSDDVWLDDEYDKEEKLFTYEGVCQFLEEAEKIFKSRRVTYDCYIGMREYSAHWWTKDGEHMIMIDSLEKGAGCRMDHSSSNWTELCHTVKKDFLAHARGQKLKRIKMQKDADAEEEWDLSWMGEVK